MRHLTVAEQACCSSSRRAVSTSAAAAGEAPPDDTWLPPDATFYVHQYPWHDKYCRQRRVMPVGPRYPALATDVYVAPSAVVAGDVDVMDGVRSATKPLPHCLTPQRAPNERSTIETALQVTIMHGSVVRGDLNNISIGPFSTVQENAVVHAARCASGALLRLRRSNALRCCACHFEALHMSLRTRASEHRRLLERAMTSGCTRRNGATGLPASTVIGMSVTIGAGSMLRSCRVENMAVIGERSIVMEGSVISAKAVLLPGTVVPPAKLIPAGQVWGGNPARFVRKLTHDEVRLAVLACHAPALFSAACRVLGGIADRRHVQSWRQTQ